MKGQRKTFKIRMVFFAVVSLLFVGLVYLQFPSDRAIHDRFFRLRTPRLAESGLAIWSLDETTLEKYGKWPFLPEDAEQLADFIAQASPAQVLVQGSTFELMNTGRIPSHIPVRDARSFLAALKPDPDGVYRFFPVTITTNGLRESSLAVVATNTIFEAQGYKPLSISGPDEPINFSGLGVRYPTVQLYKIIQEEFRTDIFTGRTILIGDTSRDTDQGLTTPFWPKDGAMPRIEYLAEAIMTLTKEKQLSRAPYHLDALLPWFFAFGLFFLGARLSVFKELLLWLSGLAVLIIAHYFLLARLEILGKVLLPALFLVVLSNTSIILRLTGIKASTDELISSFIFRSAHLTFLPKTSPGEEIWEDFARLGTIYLDPDFQAFYRLNSKNQELTSIYHEGRIGPEGFFVHSDLDSNPFAESSRRNKPMETKLPGLDTKGAPQMTFLTPIRFNGILFGFWGMAREKSFRSVQKHVISRIVTHLADEMGRRLAYQKDLEKPREPILDRLGKEQIKGRVLSLDDLVQTFEKNERFFNYAFSNMPDGIVIFNLSGEIIYFNEQAQKSLRRFSLSVTDPDFFDTIRTMSDSREEIFRKRLIALLSGSDVLRFEANSPAGQTWSVSVYPILDQQSEHPTALIAKMTDVSEMVQQRTLRTKVIHAFFGALRAMIHQTNETITSPEVEAAFTGSRRPVLDTIRGQIGGILHLLGRFEKQLEGRVAKDLTVIAPMDIAVLVREIISSKAEKAESESIHLEMDLPGEDLLVMGNRSVLSHVVESLLEMSLSHSMEGSDIWISAEQQEDRIVLKIEDSGIGFPVVYAEEPGMQTEIGELEAALKQIGGTFRADSNLGQGARFEITLPKVI